MSSLDTVFILGGLSVKRLEVPSILEKIHTNGELICTDKAMATYLYRVKLLNKEDREFPIRLERIMQLKNQEWIKTEGVVDVSTKFLTDRPVYGIKK
jgi:hypothetical protein